MWKKSFYISIFHTYSQWAELKIFAQKKPENANNTDLNYQEIFTLVSIEE